MSGAVIQCFTSDVPQLSMPIGQYITLCIPDQLLPPDNIQVSLSANGTVQMSWDRPLLVCSARNISYNINLIPTDGCPVDEGVTLPVTTEEMSITFYLTPGREYRASLIAINTDCSISSCAIQIIFTAIQNPIPGTTTLFPPTPSAPGALTTQPTTPHQQCSSITVAVAISVLVTFFTTLGVTAVLSSVITCCVTKKRNTQTLPSTKAVTQEQPVYEEALVSVSREDTIKMGENVAYGPVVR